MERRPSDGETVLTLWEGRAASQLHKAVRQKGAEVDPGELRRAFAIFDSIWAALHLRMQARVLRLLVEGISYDGAAETTVVARRATGVRALAAEARA